MGRKIAFFDIDGTLTSEIDGSVPESAAAGIRRAREKGRPVKEEMLAQARLTGIEILFESRMGVAYDLSRPLRSEKAVRLYQSFVERGYDLSIQPEQPDFVADKFVIWFQEPEQLEEIQRLILMKAKPVKKRA